MINNGERNYASLSSGLLARKGTARPAMRPQGYHTGLEDLGWNDMGNVPPPAVEELEVDLPAHVPSSISALTPSPRLSRNGEAVEEPEVVAQQRAIAENFPAEPDAADELEPEFEPAPIEEQIARPRARVVPAVTGQSAQQIVTGALDALLASIPEVEALAERAVSAKAKRS